MKQKYAMMNLADHATKFFRLLTKQRSRYPEEIQIEVTNACNLACEMCPHTTGTIPQKHFPLEWFEQLLAENTPPARIVLTGWGEPLMHPHLFEMIKRLNTSWPETQVRFTTNGLLLNQEAMAQIKRLEIAAITVSIDLWLGQGEVPKDLRSVLHVPSPKVRRNIETYFAQGSLAQRTPLIIQSLLLRENVTDIKAMIDFSSEVNLKTLNLVRMQIYDDTELSRPSWREEQMLIHELKAYGLERDVCVKSINQHSLPMQLATHRDTVCLRTDNSIYITIDGAITPCCNLRDTIIGSIDEDLILDAWNSSAEREFFCNQGETCKQCDALFHHYKNKR